LSLERTLTIIKPDGVEQGNIGDILQIFEKNQFKIRAAKMLHLTGSAAGGFYAVHAWHADVHQDNIWLQFGISVEGGLPVRGFAHDFKAGLGQDVADHRPHEDGVVADEDSVTHTPSLGRQNGG